MLPIPGVRPPGGQADINELLAQFSALSLNNAQADLMAAAAASPLQDISALQAQLDPGWLRGLGPDLTGLGGLNPGLGDVTLQSLLYQQLLQGGLGGLPPPPQASAALPALHVRVTGVTFQYQLTGDDLTKVFSRYGTVASVQVLENGASAIVVYDSWEAAGAAMANLNGKVLKGVNGTLELSYLSPPRPQMPAAPAADLSMLLEQHLMPQTNPLLGLDAASLSLLQYGYANPYALVPGAPDGAGQRGVGGVPGKPRKYTCRFEVGIENDEEFQASRRVIQNVARPVWQQVPECKTRLRGRGSGYREGVDQEESDEPLQLCVSCTDFDKYEDAVETAKKLLAKVHEEYREFIVSQGGEPPELQIKFQEQTTYWNSQPAPSPTAAAQRRPRRRLDEGEEPERGPRPRHCGVTEDEIEQLIEQRNEARRVSDYAAADRIRDELREIHGVVLMDEPGARGKGQQVTKWRYFT
mmetsp:Transcript_11565/g.26245  ORF Transcript_11565/g.26245 Transcript_11565/m.26245 type:complete len:469 (-) Transcript_11565:217-1623(-)